MDPSDDLDALVAQLETAGLVEQYVDAQGAAALRLTREGEKVARQLAMMDAHDHDSFLDAMLSTVKKPSVASSAEDLDPRWRARLAIERMEPLDERGAPLLNTAPNALGAYVGVPPDERGDVGFEQVLAFYETKDPGEQDEIKRWLEAQHEAWWAAWAEAEQFGDDRLGLPGVKAEWLWGYLNSSPLAWEVRLVNSVHDAYRSNDAHTCERAVGFLSGLQRVAASARTALLRGVCGFEETPGQAESAAR